jgi:hypothetical protein
MIVYSSDKGSSWQTLHVFNHPVFWIVLDPFNQERMYASVVHFGGTQGSQAGGVYMTNNLGNLSSSSWSKLPNPPRTEGHPASLIVLNDGKLLCTFSGRRNAQGSFTASSGVFIYDPGSASWSDVSDPGMYYWTKDIIVDPNDPDQNTWFVGVFSGWGGAPNGLGGLYRSTDRGAHWTKLTGSQFDRVTSLTFDPQNPNQAYLTSETQGLWKSDNIGDAIPTWLLVESYPFRQPERVFFNPYNQDELWVTSFGNGMKVGNLNGTSLQEESALYHDDIRIYPVPNDGSFSLFTRKPLVKGELVISDLSGRVVMQLPIRSDPGEIKFNISPPENGYYSWVLYENRIPLERGKVLFIK